MTIAVVAPFLFVDCTMNELATIFKSGSRWMWLGLHTNSYLDNDTPQQILTADAHRRYVKGVEDGTFPMPWLMIAHMPELTIGQAEAVFLDEISKDTVFVWSLGTFFDGLESVAESLSRVKSTMSHLAYPLAVSGNGRYIEDYWSFEVSVLPDGLAVPANPLTTFNSTRSKTMLTDRVKQLLKGKANLSDEQITQIESLDLNLSAQADAAGTEKKGDITPEETPATPEADAETQKGEADEAVLMAMSAFGDTVRELIADTVSKSVADALKPITERLDAVDGKVKSIEQKEGTTHVAQAYYQQAMNSFLKGSDVKTNQEAPAIDKGKGVTGDKFVDFFIARSAAQAASANSTKE